MFGKPFKTRMPGAREALPGRDQKMDVPATHHVNHGPLAPTEGHLQQAMFGMGCFWGAERMFWETPGVVSSNVGYAGGFTPNPTYEEVCSGGTGHTEVVRVFFDPSRVSYDDLLRVFWEGHDPTQGMRQHGDITTEIAPAPEFYFAEEYHQQYLAKNPNGYCGHGGTGVSCPVGVAAAQGS